jgi:hypothetical protein
MRDTINLQFLTDHEQEVGAALQHFIGLTEQYHQ